MNFKQFCVSAIGVLMLAHGGLVMAYGSQGGGGSSNCDKPKFADFQPAPNKYTQSLTEFSFEASSNTTPTSIVVTIVAGNRELEMTAKDLDISVLRSGRLEVTGRIRPAIEHGFARINVVAHSKPGCEQHDGFLVRIH